MIRHCLAVMALIAFGSGANALSPRDQTADLNGLTQRIDRLEFEAQSRGLPVPPLPIEGQPQRIQIAQSAADLAVRVDRLETQMRHYTGQMEELNFRIRQLQEQLQRFQEDSEFRFQDLEGGKRPRQNSGNLQQAPQPQQFEQLGEPPQVLGSLSQEQMAVGGALAQQGAQPSAGPIDLSSMLGGGAAPSTAAPGGQLASLTGDPATDYDLAYSHVLQGNYQAAEAAFSQFVQAHGHTDLAPNAHYWIGESRYQQADYPGAIETFLDAYSQYPTAQKAPDMLLKTGMALRQINERDAACATFEELLSKFPNASSGVRQKVMAEIKSAQC